MAFRLQIATPERLLVRADAEEAQIPGRCGYLGILPEHAPLISELKPGEISYRQGGRTERLAVSWGFVEVLPQRVTVLAQTAEKAEEIDVPRAEAARHRAQERLRHADPDTDINRARGSLERALARIQVAGKSGAVNPSTKIPFDRAL